MGDPYHKFRWPSLSYLFFCHLDHSDYFRHVLGPRTNFSVALFVVYRILILLSIKDAVSLAKSSLWAPGGTGSRIFGDNIANKAVSRGNQPSTGTKNAQDKLANMQQKLQNKNLSNKKRKELKKQERKIRSDDKKRSQTPSHNTSHHDESELVVANVQALTI